MSTYNLCFGAKNKKKGKALQTLVLQYKSGVRRGIQYTRTYFRDDTRPVTGLFRLCQYLTCYKTVSIADKSM